MSACRIFGFTFGYLCVCLTSAGLSSAQAQEAAPTAAEAAPNPEEDEARSLFLEGGRLMEKGAYQDACFAFEQSLRLVPKITTKYHLAACWEKRERKASAMKLFLEVADALKASGDTEREGVARERAAALKSQVCWLRIQLEKPVSALKVRHDGELLEEKSWSQGISADAGIYSLELVAPGKKPWSLELQVPTCPSVVSVKVPELVPAVSANATPAAQEPTSVPYNAERGPNARYSLPPDSGQGLKQTRVLAYTLGGVGIVSVVVGSVFLERYGHANEQAKRICYQSIGCTLRDVEQHQDLVDDAKSNRTRAFIGISLGGLALAGGTVALLLSDRPPSNELAQQGALQVSVTLANDGTPVGAALQGNF